MATALLLVIKGISEAVNANTAIPKLGLGEIGKDAVLKSFINHQIIDMKAADILGTKCLYQVPTAILTSEGARDHLQPARSGTGTPPDNCEHQQQAFGKSQPLTKSVTQNPVQVIVEIVWNGQANKSGKTHIRTGLFLANESGNAFNGGRHIPGNQHHRCGKNQEIETPFPILAMVRNSPTEKQ